MPGNWYVVGCTHIYVRALFLFYFISLALSLSISVHDFVAVLVQIAAC